MAATDNGRSTDTSGRGRQARAWTVAICLLALVTAARATTYVEDYGPFTVTFYGDGDLKWADGNANRYLDTNIGNINLTILATYYGFDATADAVPEPATISLAAPAALALLRRRRIGSVLLC